MSFLKHPSDPAESFIFDMNLEIRDGQSGVHGSGGNKVSAVSNACFSDQS